MKKLLTLSCQREKEKASTIKKRDIKKQKETKVEFGKVQNMDMEQHSQTDFTTA